MVLRWEGHVNGLFEGYEGGRIYTLSDGSRWLQADTTAEYVYRERPGAKLFWDQPLGRWHLDVEGTSHSVLVIRDSGLHSFGQGAY